MDDEQSRENLIPNEALERLKDPEVVRRQVKEGKTFQEILGYSNEDMEKFYQAAYGLFQKQEYQKAADAFVFLTTLNPYVHSYWLGLGMSEQLGGGYQGALLAYAMAILTNVENPVAHYHSGSCYRMLQDDENALQSFEMALRCAGDAEEFDNLKERARVAKAALEKGSKNNSRDAS